MCTLCTEQRICGVDYTSNELPNSRTLRIKGLTVPWFLMSDFLFCLKKFENAKFLCKTAIFLTF